MNVIPHTITRVHPNTPSSPTIVIFNSTPVPYKPIKLNEEGLDGFTVGRILKTGTSVIEGVDERVMLNVKDCDRKLIIYWPAYIFTEEYVIPKGPMTRGQLVLFVVRSFCSFFEIASRSRCKYEKRHLRFGNDPSGMRMDGVRVYSMMYCVNRRAWVLSFDWVGGSGPIHLK